MHIFQINGLYIDWEHLKGLYEKLHGMSADSHGLSLLPKLKRKHIELTSFSRMRVDLAAQVYIQYMYTICMRALCYVYC